MFTKLTKVIQYPQYPLLWFELEIGITPIVISKTGHRILFFTALNTEISPNSLMWKFCGKAQFPQSFACFVRDKNNKFPWRHVHF